jgi:hypothetical protein
VGESAALPSVDAILRGERVAASRWFVVLVVAGFLHGCVMGGFAGRPLQAVVSGIKVPCLLLVTTALCLPSFFAVNAVLGLRDSFAAARRAVLTSQVAFALGLCSTAPLLAFLYVCGCDYESAKLASGGCFACATVAGQAALTRAYRPLVAAEPRHRIARRAWTVLYVFVAVQLAWNLRPFIGSPGLDVVFVREGAWTNAYVVLVELVGAFVR